MSIIRTHDFTLYGGNDTDIVLRPLTDEHLKYLYKWYADAEVVYWADSGNAVAFSEKDIDGIYGNVSPNAICFLIEADGKPIGDCWLQKMNIPEVLAKYPGLDLRRIEVTIGEKSLWGEGIGSCVLSMLIDFAFNGENADMLYCFVADYNVRSAKMLLRRGFQPCGRGAAEEDSLRAKWEHHYMLEKQAFIERRRFRPAEDKIFLYPLSALQPSQLYISEGKYNNVREWFDPNDISCFDPIPVVELCGHMLMVDGHTRAVAAHLAGWKDVPVYFYTNELDAATYTKDILWCSQDHISSPIDLAMRIVSHNDYERLWRKRCMEM